MKLRLSRAIGVAHFTAFGRSRCIDDGPFQSLAVGVGHIPDRAICVNEGLVAAPEDAERFVPYSTAVGVGSNRLHDAGADSISPISRGTIPSISSRLGDDLLVSIARTLVLSAATRGVGSNGEEASA